MNNINETKKITKATFKSFVNKNRGNLYIKVSSDFDGMQDMVVNMKAPVFFKADENNDWANRENLLENTLGVAGIWLVGQSRDYFNKYEADGFVGIEVSNCCGSFTVAVKN